MQPLHTKTWRIKISYVSGTELLKQKYRIFVYVKMKIPRRDRTMVLV